MTKSSSFGDDKSFFLAIFNLDIMNEFDLLNASSSNKL